jgi:hypothetical protein
MPLSSPSRLGILTFPQRWEPNSLRVRFLCLPKIAPIEPPAAGEPSFAQAKLVFEANIIRGLDRLPRAEDATGLGALVLNEQPINKQDLFSELAKEFNIKPRVKPLVPGAAVAPRFLKQVTDSYLTLTGRRQLSDYLMGEKDFECALHDAQSSQPPEPEVLKDEVTWGQLMAYALRQPKLAMALGLIGEATIDLDDPTVFEHGGWLYISLHAESDYSAVPQPFKALFAARIPPLNEARSVYASVLFPVDGAGVADDVFREAERYDRGFARMVHGAQVQDRGDAIRLAWDDEQIAEWLNRQVDPTTEAPMGTAGYRVDVRTEGGGWNSLVRIASVADLMLGPLVLGPYAGESVVEVMPAQIAPARVGEYWMPPYFATWRGSSLVLTDSNLTVLHQHPSLLAQPDAASLLLNRERSFVAVDDTLVPLRYGKTYDFRVRLADLTLGGPAATDDTPALPQSITTIRFQRHTRPAQVNVTHRPTKDERFVTIEKPRIGYPEALFTGLKTFDQLTTKLDADILAKRERELSAPDPDVLNVEILVEVRALEGDVATYLPLYTTTRKFVEVEAGDDDEIGIDLELKTEDLATLDLLAAVQPNNGPLVIPTARDIRLTLVGLGREDPGYFASAELRRGLPITVDLRAPAQAEAPLFAAVDSPLRSFFFQPPPADGSVASPAERLAAELDLDHSGLTLAGRRGHRTVFACSAALRHTLSPERASITISSGADVIQRWINVLHFQLARDWTWDGLAEEGIAIQRRVKRPGKADLVELAGTARLPHAVSPGTISAIPPDPDPRRLVRQTTEILFFDAFDPQPKANPDPGPEPGEFPTEITIEYELAPAFKDDLPPPEPITEGILLPITTPPVQVPKLISAGIALSPYVAAGDYSATEQRRRSLWLEFESAPADPDDAYFVRVLATAPDPMLIAREEAIPEVIEPPLPIEPEWMRLIEQEQPRDDSGLRAMDPLDHQAEAGPHYLVPLPHGLTETSLELFGMFTYEIRLGHTASRWSSAQGRYGPALRIAGVQHPLPPLVCHAARNKQSIRVRAPYATAVHNGRNVRRRFPRTSLWAVVYARVRQIDAASWRNLLLGRLRMSPRQEFFDLEADARTLFGEARIEVREIELAMAQLGLPDDTPLTALAVELFDDPLPQVPLTESLGHARMLRVSPLVPVPDQC